MATIKHDAIGDVDVSGANFVQQGSAAAETFAPDILKFLGQTGLDQFKKTTLKGAENEAKNLLEALTGEKRFAQIARDESDLLGVEEDLARDFAGQEAGSPEQQFTRSQLLGLQQQKEMLALHREAVIQGHLTEDQYRKKAEMSFYTQVALTPGIRDELAAVMGEYLGIDPRGQTAKLTLEARRKLGEADDRARNKQVDLLNGAGMWNNNQSDQANINEFWPVYSKRIQGMKAVEDLVTQVNAQGTLDSAETKGIVNSARGWIAEAMPQALQSMHEFKGVSALSLTIAEIRKMDPETRNAWIDNINATRDRFTTPVAQLSTSTGEPFTEAFRTINDRASALIGILSGEQADDIIERDLGRLQTQWNIELEMEKARLVRDQNGIMTMAALSNIMPQVSTLLAGQTTVTTYLVNALNGSNMNLNALNTADKDAVLNRYRRIVSNSAAQWNADPKKWDDNDVTQMGRTGNMISNHDVEQVGHEDRMHLFKLAGAKGFMERLEAAAPEEALKMKRGVLKHQQALGSDWNKEWTQYLQTEGTPLTTLDFHIEKVGDEDAGWLVVMNSQAKDSLFEIASKKVRGPRAVQISGESKNRAVRDAVEIEAKAVAQFNRTPNLINNMVRSKAAAMSIPMKQASVLVARDFGINFNDVETTVLKSTPEEKPGFAEENLGRPLKTSSLDPTVQAILQIVAQTGASFDEVKDFIAAERANQ